MNTWPYTLLYFQKFIRIYFLNYILERYILIFCRTAQPFCASYPCIFFSMGEIHDPLCYGRLEVRYFFSSLSRIRIQSFLIKRFFWICQHQSPFVLGFALLFPLQILCPQTEVFYGILNWSWNRHKHCFVYEFTLYRILYWEIFFFSVVIWLFLSMKPVAICELNYSCINLEITCSMSTALIWVFFLICWVIVWVFLNTM